MNGRRAFAPARRRVVALLLIGAATLTSLPDARADVVPPGAVEVGEAWLALIDAGRFREAVERYGDPRDVGGSRRLLARVERITARRRPGFRRLAMHAWVGHGRGDSERMAPGSYYRLIYDTVDASGHDGTDEVRLVPLGNDRWRVVGYAADP